MPPDRDQITATRIVQSQLRDLGQQLVRMIEDEVKDKGARTIATMRAQEAVLWAHEGLRRDLDVAEIPGGAIPGKRDWSPTPAAETHPGDEGF